MSKSTALRPPSYLLRNIEQQQQALRVIQLQMQSAYNLTAEWLAEELGISLEDVIRDYDFDGKVFTPKAVSAGAPSLSD